MIPKKDQSMQSRSWDEDDQEVDVYRTLSRDEAKALFGNNKKAFATISPWLVVRIQLLMTGVCVFFWSIFADPMWGKTLYTYSAFWGGFIGFFPVLVFALRVQISRGMKNPSPGRMLSAIVSGELMKIALTVGLFLGVAFAVPNLQWLPLLVTYILTLTSYWLAWVLR